MENQNVLPLDVKGLHIHFVGIKGTGMAALVEILFAQGAVITGSDVSERFYTDEILEKLGLKALSFSESNITKDIQYVIYSSAYNVEKCPDLIAAKKMGLPLLLYTEALGEVSKAAFSAGICGVHGKTTTTGLTGTILKSLDLPSQVLAGSIISSFGNSCTMTSPSFEKDKKHYFVAETCEYQRHFMSFCPSIILLTSVESDHQDYYPTYESIRDAFVDYVCKLPLGGTLVYCEDDKGAKEVMNLAKSRRNDIRTVGYGENAIGEYKLTFVNDVNDLTFDSQKIKLTTGRQYFYIQKLGLCSLQVPGAHNARNACGAVALCNELLKADGKNPDDYKEKIKASLLDFAGGKRRSEIVGRAKTQNGEEVIVLDDYGHHPTAIKTTLSGFKDFYKEHKIIVDFMSHTYSRTEALLEEFASCFTSADIVIINKIYASARENALNAKVSGKLLSERAKTYSKDVRYAEEFSEAAEIILEELKKPSGTKGGYLVVTMGAGDNWKVGKMILEALK